MTVSPCNGFPTARSPFIISIFKKRAASAGSPLLFCIISAVKTADLLHARRLNAEGQ